MKDKNDRPFTFLAFLSIVLCVLGCIGAAIMEYNLKAQDAETEETNQTFIPVEAEETAEKTAEETETETEQLVTVFEPIEPFETATATPDTAEDSPKTNYTYTDDDLLYLAKIIENEAGCSFCTDEHQRAVASVVMNRVADPRFPDSVYGVISQGWNGECPLQYNVGSVERFNSLEPSERALANAQYVLEHGSTVGAAIWQAEFIQGEIVAYFAYPEVYETITYICK